MLKKMRYLNINLIKLISIVWFRYNILFNIEYDKMCYTFNNMVIIVD